MGYARTRSAVLRVEKILEALLLSEEDLAFPTDTPSKLAYHIHNGVYAARGFPEYNKYGRLLDKYRIRIRPSKVVCEVRDRSSDFMPGLKEQLSKMTFDEVDNVEGVVGAIIRHKPKEAYFPSFDGDMATLFKWTEQNGYHIIDHDDAGITLTNEPTTLAWQP